MTCETKARAVLQEIAAVRFEHVDNCIAAASCQLDPFKREYWLAKAREAQEACSAIYELANEARQE